MLDLFNLPTAFANSDVQVFSQGGGTAAQSKFMYNIPRGKTMLFMYALGGGGGGGGGFTGTAGTARGGGGGGGSSSVATLIIPIRFLPDTLHLEVGTAGIGGAAGAAGTAGTSSSINIYPTQTSSNTLLLSFNGNGGGAGTAAAAGTAGSGSASPTIGNNALAGLGLWNAIPGQNGTAGGAHTGASGVAISFPTTGINVMGGGGGGGTTTTDYQGSDHSSIAGSYISEQRPRGAQFGDGTSGNFQLPKLFYNYSGCGGGSSNTGVGGNGGYGGFGSGGGGGGAGTTGGRGGDGGPGLVVMIAW